MLNRLEWQGLELLDDRSRTLKTRTLERQQRRRLLHGHETKEHETTHMSQMSSMR
jgi:hypothetical protein